MGSEPAFDVELWTKDLTGREWLGAYRSLTLTPRHNLQPTGQLVIDSDRDIAGMLTTPGCRYRALLDGDHVSSGMVRTVAGTFGTDGALTVQLEDDWRLLRRILGWQVPGSAIGSQSAAEYATYTGPAETVVKNLIAANVTRLGAALQQPVTIAASLGRGATITVQTRMHAPADRLFPLVDQAGVGVTVRQAADGSGLVVDCYEPTTFPVDLSHDSGTLDGGSWTRIPPEATRVVVAAGGEGTARVHREYVDAAAEAAWGDLIEGYVDARDIDPAAANLEALMSARGAEALAAAKARAGLSLELVESDTFRYGGADGIRVGDRVTVALAAGLDPVTDVVREATITDSHDNGLTATPIVGERTDTDSRLVRFVGEIARAVRNQARS